MKFFTIISFIIFLLLTSIEYSDAKNRTGSTRNGGKNSHGKGSHYRGGRK